MLPACCLTTSWDDGHPLDLRVAEMLREHHLQGTFYVPRSARTGTMSAAHLREVAESFEIGGHTLDHVYLTEVPEAQADRQIVECKSWVEQTTGRPCVMFCPPAGKYALHHVSSARDCGYTGIRSVELLSLSPPRRLNGLLIMPTTLQAHPHQRLTYAKNTIKRRAWTNLWEYVVHGCPTDWEALAESLLARVVVCGGVFHLWGHSWELQCNAQWDRLDRVLRIMSQLTDAPCLSNGQVCRQTGE